MVVCRLRKRALVLCCSIFLFVVLITTISEKHEDRTGENIYSKRKNPRDYTRIKSGLPRAQNTTNAIGIPKEINNEISTSSTCKSCTDLVMDVAAVVCGDRLEEAMNMVKSILIFTKHKLCFHIVAEKRLQAELKRKFESFLSGARQHFDYTIYNLSYPVGEDKTAWKKLFKVCASQRLFLMNFIKRDRILYLDTDTLVVSPLEYLWKHFRKFNTSQLAALAPEGEVPALNWYSRFARHPYYGKLGLNSGVMLMDLKKLRQVDFENKIINIYKEYKFLTTWGDQDLLNIFFHQHPEKVFVYPCEWNYRPDHCMYGNNCLSALHNGVYVIHGNRGVFHNQKQLAFKLIYNVIKDYKFGKDIKATIVMRAVSMSDDDDNDMHCQQMVQTFTKNMLNK